MLRIGNENFPNPLKPNEAVLVLVPPHMWRRMPCRVRLGHREFPVLLLSMLLKGGCGYED